MSNGQQTISDAQRDFAAEWDSGGAPPHPGEFLKRYADWPEGIRRGIAQAVVRVDLEQRWERWRQHAERVADGASVPAAPVLKDYVGLCPDLGTLDSIPPDLIRFEFSTRARMGDEVSIEDYATLYPHAADALGEVPGARDTADIKPDQTVVENSTHPPVTMRPGELPDRFNNYEILRELGRGAMGIVYLAHHKVLDTKIAIKAILTDRFPSREEIELFLNEARIAGNLRHENIVRVLEAGQYEGTYFIAMEYVDGSGLDERIRERPLNPDEAARVIKTVADAMHFAHTQPQPVYHRDLKPANILVTADNTPYVCDFGIAKRVETDRTSSDSVVGTPSYMPPEQALGRKVDARSDVYSLGSVLYTLIVGRPPFAAGDVRQTLEQVVHRDPVAPSELNPVVSRDLEAICLKCLSKKPDARYRTAQDLADDLDNLLNDRPIIARPPSLLARFGKWKRRNPGMARMALTIAILLVFTAASSVFAAANFYLLKVQAESAEASERKAKDEAIILKGDAETARDKAKVAEQKAVDSEKGAVKARDQAIKAEISAKTAEKDERLAKEEAVDARKDAEKARDTAKKAEMAAVTAAMQERKAKEAAVTAQTEAVRQTGIAKSNLNVSREVIDVLILGLADDGLDDIPGMQTLRRDIVAEAGRLMQELGSQPENASPELKIQTAKTRLRLGLIHKLVGEKAKARIEFQAAHDIVRPIEKSVAASVTRIQAMRGLAEVTEAKEQEEQQLFNAATFAGQLVRDFPADSDALFEAALTFNSLGFCLSDLGEREEAIARFQATEDLYGRLLQVVAPPPQKNEWARRYAESLNNRALQVRLVETRANVETALNLFLAAFEVQLDLLNQNAAGISQPAADGGLSGLRLRTRLEELIERYDAILGDASVQRSRVVRNDAAQTLINAANSCLAMGALEYEANRAAAMSWYRLALQVSRQARSGYDGLARDFPSIPDYPLRLSASVLTEVAASIPDENNDLKDLIQISNDQIKVCDELASRFRGRQSDFNSLRDTWNRLRADIQSRL